MDAKYKTVGVIMLETKFPRLVGDIGNPDGFPFPILYEIVEGASPARVVKDKDPDLLKPFIEAGQKLISRGADIITTSCGFLILFQTELQAALSAPVYTSALLLVDELEASFGTGNVGVLTISKDAMTQDFLSKSGVGSNVPIGSTESGKEFSQSILSNAASFNTEQCEADIVSAAHMLVSAHPHIKAIVLECTNMSPHMHAIKVATKLNVYSLTNILNRESLIADQTM